MHAELSRSIRWTCSHPFAFTRVSANGRRCRLYGLSWHTIKQIRIGKRHFYHSVDCTPYRVFAECKPTVPYCVHTRLVCLGLLITLLTLSTDQYIRFNEMMEFSHRPAFKCTSAFRPQAFRTAAQALNGSEVTSGQQLWNDLSDNLVDTPFEVSFCAL